MVWAKLRNGIELALWYAFERKTSKMRKEYEEMFPSTPTSIKPGKTVT